MSHLLAFGDSAARVREPRAKCDAHAADADPSAGFDRSRSLPGGASEWQLPMPPVRFPLREAREALYQDYSTHPPTPRTAAAMAQLAGKSGPLIVKYNEKFRAIRDIGHRRRHGVDGMPFVEKPVMEPKPPPAAPKPPIRQLLSKATTERRRFLQGTQTAGGSQWQTYANSASEPSLPSQDNVRGTWTSAARAVLSHARRQGAEAHAATSPGDGPLVPRALSDWVSNGLEFTERGLGIGERFAEHRDLQRRSPGPIYDVAQSGSVSLYLNHASLPTKQPSAKYTSTRTHRIGERREECTKKWDLQRPGPGAYEFVGFTDAILRNAARRNRHDVSLASGASQAPSEASVQGAH